MYTFSWIKMNVLSVVARLGSRIYSVCMYTFNNNNNNNTVIIIIYNKNNNSNLVIYIKLYSYYLYNFNILHDFADQSKI